MRKLLILPTLVILGVFFILPIILTLSSSVYNDTVSTLLPLTSKALQTSQIAHQSLINDLKLHSRTSTGKLANYLNRKHPGMRTLILNTASDVKRGSPLGVEWKNRDLWNTIRKESSNISLTNYSRIFDTELPYITVLTRTLLVSALIACVTLILSYPIAYLLVSLQSSSNIILFIVMLPLWTSILTRIMIWIILLQNQGVLNKLLIYLGVIDTTLPLMHNLFGIIITTVYIFIPFMVLPLYSTMKEIPLHYLDIAQVCGHTRFKAFWTVYFPLTLKGVLTSLLLVYILCIGYFITPEMMGGGRGQFIANSIIFHMHESLNWGLASALTTVLLGIVTFLFIIYIRLSHRVK
jgi:putative spermidine/putrescine transport system permease protein